MGYRSQLVFSWQGRMCIPFEEVLLSCGLFLPAALNLQHQHLSVPPELVLGAQDSYLAGRRRPRTELAAARAHGNSMTRLDVRNGDFVLFERIDPATDITGQTVVIEKVGDEEGFGSLALKNVVVVRPRTAYLDTFENEIDWNNPEIVLRSANRKFPARDLDSTGIYRAHGFFRRAVSPDLAYLVDSEDLRRVVEGTEIEPE